MWNINNVNGIDRIGIAGFADMNKSEKPASAAINCTAPAFKGSAPYFSDSLALKTDEDKKMYKELLNSLDVKTKGKLEALLKTGRLMSRDSNDGSSTLENLYKIHTTPRVRGLDKEVILEETIKTLQNPFIITQNFGKIPEPLVPEVLENSKLDKITGIMGLNGSLVEKYVRSKSDTSNKNLTPEDLDVTSSGACVAASIEFNLADKKPAEFARYAEGLTNPSVSVKTKVKYSDIANSFLDSVNLLKSFNVDFKTKNWQEIEVDLKPDRNAIIRARVQNTFREPGSRSLIDVLMQSAFMQLGSESTYDSLTDKRYGAFNMNEKGLTEFEKNFAEAIVDNDGGKSSVTYQIVDDNARLVGYNFDTETTKKHLLDSLNAGYNVIIGITEVDDTSKIIGGHEITVIDKRVDEKGELYFICNDTDDNYEAPIEIRAVDLIPKIHHAGISNKVLSLPPIPDAGFELLKEYNNTKKHDYLYQNGFYRPVQA
jgi:hypothetical protein